MIQGLRDRLGKGLAALAAMLIALLVAQAPVAIVDRALHVSGHDHAANPFAGALAMDLADHDHEGDRPAAGGHHDRDQGPLAGQGSVDDDGRDPASPQGAHHHHDGPSVYGVVGADPLARAWTVATQPWPGDGPRLASAGTSPQERPPKAPLEHVA